jgi:hypothetical protein
MSRSTVWSWPVRDLQELECSIVLRCSTAAFSRPFSDGEPAPKESSRTAGADSQELRAAVESLAHIIRERHGFRSNSDEWRLSERWYTDLSRKY